MSLYEEDDYTRSGLIDPEVDLDAGERGGNLLLPCYTVFADLDYPGKVEDYEEKWQLTFRLPKNASATWTSGPLQGEARLTSTGEEITWGSLLFAVCDLIGVKTWKGESEEKLEAIWGCIEAGIPPKNSNISIQDGDLHKPEYNAGHWLIKASRRPNEGPPSVLDVESRPIAVHGQEGPMFTGELKDIPKIHDYIVALIRVWAQKKRERLNFTIEGVRQVERGAGAKAVNAARAKEITNQLSGSSLPALPSGPMTARAEQEALASQPVKKSAKKKGAKKKGAAKRGTTKQKKGSVFARRRK